MDITRVMEIYESYTRRSVLDVMHPDERMVAKNYSIYEQVGRDAIRSIVAGLCLSRTNSNINRICDYGCGHGRVGRHLRAFFPEAELFFADVRKDGVDFCAETFEGSGTVLVSEFKYQKLPEMLDLIWVGSVFTHIDFKRAKELFCILFDKLAPNGKLIMTLHGRPILQPPLLDMIGQPTVQKIAQQCDQEGWGYQSYNLADLGEWGGSMMDMGCLPEFFKLRPQAKLIAYSEAGWAGQDVIIVENASR